MAYAETTHIYDDSGHLRHLGLEGVWDRETGKQSRAFWAGQDGSDILQVTCYKMMNETEYQ